MGDWVSVDEALPSKDGDYICARQGYNYEPEIVSFQCSEENRSFWNDAPPHIAGGGCNWFGLTEKQKLRLEKFGRVTHWQPLPSLPELTKNT